jgi:hypothetical protein
MQRKESAASARFLAVQLHEAWSRSAAFRVGQHSTPGGQSDRRIQRREAVARSPPRIGCQRPPDFTRTCARMSLAPSQRGRRIAPLDIRVCEEQHICPNQPNGGYV